MNLGTELIPQRTVADYEALCATIIQRTEDAYHVLAQARELAEQLDPYAMPSELSAYRLPELDAVKHKIWYTAWIKTFEQTALPSIMDAQSIKEFKGMLDKNAVPYTEDNVRSTLVGMAEQADKLFQRGIVNLFESLSPRYCRHVKTPFRLPPRIIVSSGCSTWTSRHEVSFERRDALNDMDRVFKTLDGQPPMPYELEAKVNAAWQSGEAYEDAYYKIVGFQNRNMHITFKKTRLLEKVNEQIAHFYGDNALGKAAAQR